MKDFTFKVKASDMKEFWGEIKCLTRRYTNKHIKDIPLYHMSFLYWRNSKYRMYFDNIVKYYASK